MRKLKEIAELYAGVITSRVLYDGKGVEKGREIKVLVPKAVAGGRVERGSLADELLKDVSDDKISKFLTKEGDIVVKFSSPYEACVIQKEDEGLLVPSFCCRVVPKSNSEFDIMYLLAFLNSSVVQEQIIRICHGRTIALLRKSDLEAIEIPEIPLEEQADIGKRYVAYLDFIEKAEELKKLEKERMDTVFVEIESCR